MGHISKSQLTIKLSGLLEEYLTSTKRLKESTRDLLQRAWYYLIKAVGDIEMGQFSFKDAERYQSYIIEQGLNRTTANIYIKAVRPVFTKQVQFGTITEHPFKHLRLFRVPQDDVRVFEAGEIRAILASAPNDVWRCRIWSGLSGLRIGEVLNLTLDDIDFENGYINIQPKKETALTWYWEPKDIDKRLVPLSPELNRLLVTSIIPSLPVGQPYLMLSEDRYLHLQWLRRIGKMSNRIKSCPDGKYCRLFKRILRGAGITKGEFHDLRKTAITKWLGSLQVQEVQILAGHASTRTTLRYYYSANNRTIADKARQVKMCSL